jgi:hypothetical protein
MELYAWVRGLRRFSHNAHEALPCILALTDVVEKVLIRAAILAVILHEICRLFRGL